MGDDIPEHLGTGTGFGNHEPGSLGMGTLYYNNNNNINNIFKYIYLSGFQDKLGFWNHSNTFALPHPFCLPMLVADLDLSWANCQQPIRSLHVVGSCFVFGGELASPPYVMATDATNFSRSLLQNGSADQLAKVVEITGQ